MSDEAERSRPDPRPVPKTAKPCPICGRPAVADVAPFCSRRCADVDLNRWLGGVYRVPTEPDDEVSPDAG